MSAHKGFFGISFRQFTFIPHLYMIIIDMHLNVRPRIVLMRNRIIEYFSHGLLGNLQFLVTLHTLETYRRNQIFGLQYFHHTVCHLNDIALNDILEHKVCFILSETTYLECHAWEEFKGILAKQQYGSILQQAVIVN